MPSRKRKPTLPPRRKGPRPLAAERVRRRRISTHLSAEEWHVVAPHVRGTIGQWLRAVVLAAAAAELAR